MDERTAKAFEHFWGRIGSTEHSIFDWTGPRLPPFVKEGMDDSWFEDYDAIRMALKPLAKRRPFIAPAEATGDAVFQAETAHEALMFILNPPDALFGLPHILTGREYLDIKREAQEEFRRMLEIHTGIDDNQKTSPEEGPPTRGKCTAALRPQWDGERRILWYGEKSCNRYSQPAANQIAIITEFETAGWPPRIDDPLGTGPNNATRQRTSDAVRALNEKINFIHFRLSGDKKSIVWDPR